MSGGQTVASGTAASGLCVSNLNDSLLSVQYRTNRQVTPNRSVSGVFLDRNPLNFIERDFIMPAIIKLGRPR